MDCLFLDTRMGSDLEMDYPLHWQRKAAPVQATFLEACGGELAGQSVALVVPAELVTSLLVNLPTQKARLVRQALPFAVEELLADDVEAYHLTLGEQLSDGRHRVFAIDRNLLEGWLARVAHAGIRVARIHVDADLVPGEGLQVLPIGDRYLLGGRAAVRLAVAGDQFPLVQSFLTVTPQMVETSEPYQLMAVHCDRATDLAQGEFALRTDGKRYGVWRSVALVVGLWFSLHLGYSVAQGWLLERQGEEYARQSLELYKSLFPGDQRIVNLRAQFADHLNQGARGKGDFISMLQQASSAISDAKAALTINQIDYNQSRGDLALEVHAKDFSELEQLRKRLTDNGLTVQLGSASRADQGVTARVVLAGGE